MCSYFASPHPKATIPSFSPSTLFLCYIPSRFALSLITIIIPSFFAFNNLQQSERMAARVGSFRHSFLEKSKERLLSKKEYQDFVGFNGDHDASPKRSFLDALSDGVISFHNWSRDVASKLYEMGRSDRRKVIFAVKAGLSLAIVSLVIYIEEEQFSKYSVWAILTVVVVFEFSIGMILINFYATCSQIY